MVALIYGFNSWTESSPRINQENSDSSENNNRKAHMEDIEAGESERVKEGEREQGVEGPSQIAYENLSGIRNNVIEALATSESDSDFEDCDSAPWSPVTGSRTEALLGPGARDVNRATALARLGGLR